MALLSGGSPIGLLIARGTLPPPEIGLFMSKIIRTFHNGQNEEVGRLTFEEKDDRLHVRSSAPPGIDRRFRTEKGAADWWQSNVDPETGKIRRPRHV